MCLRTLNIKSSHAVKWYNKSQKEINAIQKINFKLYSIISIHMHFLYTKFYLSIIYIRITSHEAMCHSWKNTEFEVRGSRFKYELCQEGWQLRANYLAWASGFSLSLETTPATPGQWLCEWAVKCSDTHGSPKGQLSLPSSIYMGNVDFSDHRQWWPIFLKNVNFHLHLKWNYWNCF